MIRAVVSPTATPVITLSVYNSDLNGLLCGLLDYRLVGDVKRLQKDSNATNIHAFEVSSS